MKGIWTHWFADWEADRFVDRDFSLLAEAVAEDGSWVYPAAASTLRFRTGKRLREGERVYIFRQSDDFRWFFLGSACNVGIVVVEGGKVVEIHRTIIVESL
ncbi:hypothetical protein [Congregicoccus parvus]|uniref:hypothetical protein n=1 Tax=Congregicoccus parvus TaxID=3081749 RepID=UPI003FA5A141